ncbi:hypothetical protein HOP50_14g73740 [Chloropicon primus]|uniref:Uncharacterized protein n=1 Tax=Chloropicon primus TaxID=1764295 RepID=A0A5B8MYV9_9CHLO|nr:hypothetical protein A3770_14p73500 [Chloropicon primus]UPR04041.1 hypothetical protein HOP50_14g73740 [Chloropicon primus]|eukprot:QDZ24832.1 hypothetical protein A3770_14p73500 [Chloropicon primus]
MTRPSVEPEAGESRQDMVSEKLRGILELRGKIQNLANELLAGEETILELLRKRPFHVSPTHFSAVELEDMKKKMESVKCLLDYMNNVDPKILETAPSRDRKSLD